jgi:hypothetical protein
MDDSDQEQQESTQQKNKQQQQQKGIVPASKNDVLIFGARVKGTQSQKRTPQQAHQKKRKVDSMKDLMNFANRGDSKRKKTKF